MQPLAFIHGGRLMPGHPKPRLKPLVNSRLNAKQRELRDAIRSGPRGKFSSGGPFGVWLHAPALGLLTQKLGAHCRYQTGLPPRLSEFAILVTARLWRAQYEWFAHAPIAGRAGVKPQTIRDLRAGRIPKTASKDERAIYDFVRELYETKRVSSRTYARVNSLLGDTAVVELVGILGYYALVAMTLNVFRMSPPPDVSLPFREPPGG
ncbi:MAG: 4-carboxymuconolactone decarboxylase [Alphaproteobacteria bacterium]|nr:4-carboxymuconolactone decarboxylase [Alphaproteobacteria bacterium]